MRPDLPPLPEDIVATLNANRGGFNALIDLEITAASYASVSARIAVGPKHAQPYGLIHGGVHAAILETLCSTGAALHVLHLGHGVVGLENHTSFLRAARGGVVTATVTPLATGRRSHVWRGDVLDEDGRVLATGQVRLMVLATGASVAGEAIPSGLAKG